MGSVDNNRKPSVFPTQNNNQCTNPGCGWEGDGKDMPYKGISTILSCPQCGGTSFNSVLKPEFSKMSPIDTKAPFKGERKHIAAGPWRIY